MKSSISNLLIIIFTCGPGILIAQRKTSRDNVNSSAKTFYMRCMNDMMNSMVQKSSTISPDVDFLQQMIAHHEGAVCMAKYEISYGENADMIQLAKSILFEQSSEIKMMHLWLNTSMPTSIIPDKYKVAIDASMQNMMKDMMADTITSNKDEIFAAIMIPHHKAAIDMAKSILIISANTQVVAFAKQIISNEQIEIEQMLAFIK